MEIQEIVASLENPLELLGPAELVRIPVYLGTIVFTKQAVHVVLDIPAFRRDRMLVDAGEGERSSQQGALASEKVEEDLFDSVDSADLITMCAAEHDHM